MALRNVRVIELAGLAPAPFCGMILSDFGADVVRIDRIGGDPLKALLNRGKKCLQVDLKRSEGKKVFETLCTKADVIIEPYRPGVMEKMGLGPEKLMKLNNRLIYARLSGFGQQGPLSQQAGHDINYLSVSGLLSLFKAFGKNSLPNPPINILADFAAGGLSCALGITMALVERNTSGLGQVVDANMTEGCSYLASYIRESRNNPLFKQFMWPNPDKSGENLLDGGAPFYSVYRTLDDKYMAVGALEPQFFALFIQKIGLEGDYYPGIIDQSMREKLTKIFESKTQKEWIEIFDGTDACVTPVVDFDNAAEFDHNKTNKSFLADGMPVPAPRLTRTIADPVLVEKQIEDINEFLQEYGFDKNKIHELLESKVVDLPKLTRSKL